MSEIKKDSGQFDDPELVAAQRAEQEAIPRTPLS